MNRNLIIVLAGGFLIAVLVAVLVQVSLGGKKKKPAAQMETVQIVVASKNLGVGTELSDDNIEWKKWPKSGLFPGAVVRKEGKKPSEMISGVLQRPVGAGEPVLKKAIIDESDGNFVAASLRDGMRAVGLDVKTSMIAGGLLKPGDYVDVIMTYKNRVTYSGNDPQNLISDMIELNLDKLATETILQNVRVLAVGSSYDSGSSSDDDDDGKKKKKKSKKKSKVKTITLEVDLRGAEVLALAKEMGKLTLAMRKLGDDKFYDRQYSVITDERLTQVTDDIYGKILEIQKSSGQDGNIVRIYNGYVQEQVPVTP